MAEEVNFEALIKYVEEESGVPWTDVPHTDQVAWVPVGHPNLASPFRDAIGLPVYLKSGDLWPLSGGGQRILIIFEDGDEYRLYCLPARVPNEGEDLPPRRYRLSKHGFTFSSQRMSFATWREQIVVEVRLAMSVDDSEFDPEQVAAEREAVDDLVEAVSDLASIPPHVKALIDAVREARGDDAGVNDDGPASGPSAVAPGSSTPAS